MQKWKKALSVLLMMGLLTTAGASMAWAEEDGEAVYGPPRGGGLCLNEAWLAEQIAGLSEAQQTEILALQAELAALQPEKEQREKQTFTAEQQAVLEAYQAQIKAKEEAVTALLQAAGVTLNAPDKPDQEAIARTLPERTDGTEQALPEGDLPKGGRDDRGPRGGFAGRLVSAEAMAQLDDETKAQLQSLEGEIKALRSALAADLGLEQPEKPELTEAEQAAREKARTVQQQLRQALQQAGITLPQPPTKEAEQV